MDGNGVGEAMGGANFGGGSGVGIANHGDQVGWEPHVGECGENGCVRDAPERVLNVEPG